MEIKKIITEKTMKVGKNNPWDYCKERNIPIIDRYKKRNYSELFIDSDTVRKFEELLTGDRNEAEIYRILDGLWISVTEYIERNAEKFKPKKKKNELYMKHCGQYLNVINIKNEFFEEVAEDLLNIYIDSWKEFYIFK